MVRTLAWVLLLQGVLCQEDDLLRDRIEELEGLVAKHQEKLLVQQGRLEEHRRQKDRRLQSATLPASIHGASNSTRAYTFDEKVAGAMDQMWLLLCGALVMFMQAGFAMVESGTCRAKNAQNILLKNLTDVCMGTLGWWFSGWALAYSGPYTDDGILKNGFLGYESWFGAGFVTFNGDGKIEPTLNMANWFFQWTFCSAAATIVSGGVAERVNFLGYCIFSFLMTSFVYPIIVAWTWGYGFLSTITRTGFMDFAGSGIAHMTGGVAALVGAAMAGPRKGRFELPEDYFAAHSLPLVVFGTLILWFGWYGFNCGSTLGLSDIATGFMAAQVAMNTTIAAASGGISVFVIRYVIKKKYDIAGMCNGILAGLVSITAGCGNVECGSACFIAMIGGAVYFAASEGLKMLQIDDPIDAFAVHGVAGAWGVLAAAIFDWGRGFDHFHGWSGFSCVTEDDGTCMKGAADDGLAANAAQIVLVSLWTAFWSALIFLPLRLSGKLRVSDEAQDEGMDASKHCPKAAYDHGEGGANGLIYTSKVSPITEHLE